MVANLAAHLDGGKCGFEVLGFAERIRLDQERIVGIWPRQPQAAPAFRLGQAREHGPAMGRRVDARFLWGGHREFELALQDIGLFEARIALPVERGLAPAAADALWLVIGPGAAEGEVVLVVAADAGKVAHDRDAVGGKLFLGADA